MRRFAGACRFVYNKALALQKETHGGGGKFISYVGMAKWLTGWRNSIETPWLKDGPVHAQQHALKHLERAYRNFFEGRAAFPQFKRQGLSDSFISPDRKAIRLDRENGRISLPKLGWLRYRNSRMVGGEVRSATVSLRAGKSILTACGMRHARSRRPYRMAPAVGIDVGVARFATLSDGTFIAPLASFAKHERRLAKYQRRMARKVKGSANSKKAKARIQRIHARIANARADGLRVCCLPASAPAIRKGCAACWKDKTRVWVLRRGHSSK